MAKVLLDLKCKVTTDTDMKTPEELAKAYSNIEITQIIGKRDEEKKAALARSKAKKQKEKL